VRVIEGLYAVTPDEPDTATLVRLVGAAVTGGATIVQYRNKGATSALRREQATALLRVCRDKGAALIVNDHVELALEISADGVHVGREDGDVAGTRVRLGEDRILGVSCYNDLALALRARDAGATYVAFGGFFRSTTKPGTASSPLSLLADAKRVTGLPVVAIGGITLENATPLIEAGADAVAVISSLFGGNDVMITARSFAALFESRKA
jgi:thiamine-phosphate pyrophosphorylase